MSLTGVLRTLYRMSWYRGILWDDAVRHEQWFRGTAILHTKALEAPREAPSLAPRNSGRHGGGYASLGIAAVSTPKRLHGGVDMRGCARLYACMTGLAAAWSQHLCKGRGRKELGRLWSKHKTMF